MMGLGVAELVLLALVALGVFSVVGAVGFRVLEKLLTPKQWEPDRLDAPRSGRENPDEVELMRDEQRWLGDRLTAVERKLPDLRKAQEGNPLDRLVERPREVDGEGASGSGDEPGGADGRRATGSAS